MGSVYFHHRIGHAFGQVDEEEGKLSSIVQENLTGVRVIRAFGKESYERQRFESQNHGYTDLWVRLQKILAAFWTYGNIVATTRNLIITVLGAVLCVQDHLTAGQFIAFFTYNTMLSLPVRSLGRVIAEMSKAGIAIDRIRYIMNASEEEQTGKNLQVNMNQDIRFENVSYQFENGNHKVLDAVSLTIPAGSTVGILGQTGSGKSTLMYLLDRLYELRQGDIYIGDTSIKDIDRHWLREHIGMVLQEPFLFSRTLLENIGIATRKLSQSEVDRVTHIASLQETIDHFTEGFETFVGERGVTLSGGQKQRTAIAQMLVRKPPIMIFDDSLSAVDAQTDAQIRSSLQAESGKVTSILISHRISTIKDADRIFVMKQGRIIQQGTHDELVNQNGLYKYTYELQTSQEEDNEK